MLIVQIKLELTT